MPILQRPIQILVKAALLASLMRAAPGQAQERDPDVLPPHACAIGGGIQLSPRAATTFDIMVQNDSLYFDGIIVGRAQAGWKGFNGTRRQLVEPIRAGAAKYLTGATIDTLFLQFDRKARIAWIHTMRVPMDTNNVVLVDRLDTRGGAPHVAGMLKIASPVPINGHCGDADFFQTLSETMSRVLRGIPAIAAFIGVPLPDEP